MLANHANVIQFPNLRPSIPVVIPKKFDDSDIECVTVGGDLLAIDACVGDALIFSRRYTSYTEKSVFVIRLNSTGETLAKRLEYNGNTVTLKTLADSVDDFELPASDVVILGKVVGIQRPFDF